jgi:plastocyanin
MTIHKGTAVTWQDMTGTAHTITAGKRGDPVLPVNTNPADFKQYNTGQTTANGSYSFTFSALGSFDYYCIDHIGQDAKIVVIA